MSLALRQFRFELIKLFARKRTWVGFGIFVALELLIFLLCNYPPIFRDIQRNIARQGLLAAEYTGGVTIGFMVFMATSVLGIIFLSLVSGDIVAKEIEDGTMRMTLCRPVSRIRVLAVKYAACVVHHCAFVFFVGLSILGVGVAWLGVGGFFLFVPEERILAMFSPAEGLGRYLLALPFFCISLLTATTLGFFFSCCNMKPVVATVMAIVVLLIDRILYELPFFNQVKTWFMHYRLVKWSSVLKETIPWDRMLIDYVWLFALNVTLFAIATTIFCRRDFKS